MASRGCVLRRGPRQVFGAAFVLSGLHSAQGRIAAVTYWVISDHREELGRPERLFHNGFGLLSIDSPRKPRYWCGAPGRAPRRSHTEYLRRRDGAGSLVQAWAARP